MILVAKPGGGSAARTESDEEEPEVGDRGGVGEEAVEEGDAGADAAPGCGNLPNVVCGPNGRLRPASGYVWVDEDDPDDLRVELMPGLIKTASGYRPARGYTWVSPRDPNDLRVRPVR